MNDDEINSLVARKLGMEVRSPTKCESEEPSHVHVSDPHRGIWCLPDYCHSIEAAWEVVEKLNNQDITIAIVNRYDKQWAVKIMNKPPGIESVADTAPMAVALCFLKLEDK